MPVQSAEARIEHDPQLRHRDLYSPRDHPDLGRHPQQNVPFKLSATPVVNRSAGPRIGEHTREVLEGLLGFTRAELEAGFTDGTLWPEGRERYDYLDEMLK